MNYNIDQKGYYGDFGGAYIPEMLYPNILELKKNYLSITNKANFKKDFNQLHKEYVGRPTPLYFAKRLSRKYNTKIYLKREDLCHTGAHKINNTIGQILLAKHLGKKRIIAETGAGQHGVATATVCALMGVKCVIYMGNVDIKRQAPNVARMKMLGADVRSVKSGSKTLKDATNEAIRDWVGNVEDTYYLIGSVVGPHPYPMIVRNFQSIIGKETKQQFELIKKDNSLTTIIACIGGGSNAIGMFFPFLDTNIRLVGVEAAGSGLDTDKHAATISKGEYGVLHGSASYLLQTKDGQVKLPYSISAGLDYPGVGPEHSYLKSSDRVEYVSATDEEAIDAYQWLARKEGIIPALESSHALSYLKRRDNKIKKGSNVIVCLSGRGDKDIYTIDCYLNQNS